jgi:hypothetical protein
MPAGPFKAQTVLNARDRAEASGIAAPGDVVAGLDLVVVVEAATDYGSLEGRVLAASGAAQAGAVVSVGDRAVQSGSDGSFLLPGLEVKPGSLQSVSARTRDGRSGTASFVLNAPGTVHRDVVLSGLGSALLQVVGPRGEPLSDLDVAVLDGCDDPCGCRFGKTGPDGQVRFDGLPAGTTRVQALKLGATLDAARAPVTILGDGDVAQVTLRLGGLGTVSGIVLDPDGRPALGADVVLQSNRFVSDGSVCGLAYGTSHRSRTGSDGRFSVPRVNAGPVSATASQAFYPTQAGASGVVADSVETRLTIRLVNTTAGELSGRVLAPDGVAPAGRGIEVTASGPLPDATVKTDDAGVFRFARIFPEGQYAVVARDPVGGSVVESRVYLRAGLDEVHDLRLKGKGVVRVRVRDGLGRPVEPAFVTLVESEFPYKRHELPIGPGSDGVATFPGVFEGPFSVEVRDGLGRGGRTASGLPAPGATQEVTVFVDASGAVTGHFLKRDGRSPIPFGLVSLRSAGRVVGQVATDSAPDPGFFRFDRVPPGSFEVTAIDPLGSRRATYRGEIVREGDEVEVRLVAQGLGTVQGAVTQNSAPRPGARVALVSGDFRVETLADATGRYVISGVPEGHVAVTASATEGALAATAGGDLVGEAQSLTLDLVLAGTGSIAGRVVRPDGTPATPSSIRLDGALTAFTTSDETGAFAFRSVPAGRVVLAALDLTGPDYGRGSVDVIEGQESRPVVVLNGLGSVAVRVRDAHGQPVSAAGVRIQSQSQRYADLATLLASTDDAGMAAFPRVPSGRLAADALDPQTALSGATLGPVLADGGTASLEIVLEGAGRLAGRVSSFDGVPVPGARVMAALANGRRDAFSDAAGRFEYENVKAGPFVVDVETEAGDHARVTGQVQVDATTQIEAVLAGLGRVRVVVLDELGSPVSGVHVTVASGNVREGESDHAGVAVVENVRAGAIRVDVFDPVRASGASAAADLAAGSEVAVELSLQPAGRVRGRVVAPDATTPVPGARLQAMGRSTVTGPDGRFELANLPLEVTFDIEVLRDERPRARKGVRLTVDGPDADIGDLPLLGLGRVGGLLYGVDAVPVPNQRVRLEQAGYPGGTSTALTDAAGRFVFEAVAVGDFRLFADAGADRAYGAGRLDDDGAVAEVALHLLASALALPQDLYDANGFRFGVSRDGTVDGPDGFFGQGGPRLTIALAEGTLAFAGSADAAASASDGREIVLHDERPGLLLERRVYVPTDGYFARYLDSVTNTTPAPLSLTIQEHLPFGPQMAGGVSPFATSSGDAALDGTDTFVVLDDEDGDWYARDPLAPHRPPLVVIAGTDHGVLSRDDAGLTYASAQLTLAPGARASLLHFVSLQADRARALASAERLARLPPEALSGLTPEDAAAVVNFAVPADLASSELPLPPNDGFVTGTVLAGDAATTVYGADVALRSASPYFGRPLRVRAGADGRFVVPSSDSSEGRRVVPRLPFELVASVEQAGLQTASAAGTFAESGAMDLTSLHGRTLRASSGADRERAVDGDVASAFAWAAGDTASPGAGTPYFELALPVAGVVDRVAATGANFRRGRIELRDARGEVLWLEERSLEGELVVEVPRVAGVRAVRLVDVVDGGSEPRFGELAVRGEAASTTGRSSADVVFDGTGLIEARVLRSDGSPLAGARTLASPSLFGDPRVASPLSRYLVVPPGDYALAALAPGDSVAAATVPVAVDAGLTARVDLVLPALGSIRGRLLAADGTLVAGSLLVRGPGGERSQSAHGVFVFDDLLPGAWEVRASVASQTLVRILDVQGGAVSANDFTFLASGRVRVAVTESGAPLDGATVLWRPQAQASGSLGQCVTDASGACVLDNVSGAVRVEARHPRSLWVAAAATTEIDFDGQQRELALDLETPGTLQIAVRRADGSPAPGAVVHVLDGTRTLVSTGTDAAGRLTASGLPPTRLRVQAARSNQLNRPFTETEVALEPGATRDVDVDLIGAIRAAGDAEVFRLAAPAGSIIAGQAFGVAEGTLNALPGPLVSVQDLGTGWFELQVRAQGSGIGAFQFNTPGDRPIRKPEGRAFGRVLVRPDDAAASGQAVRLVVGQARRQIAADPLGWFDTAGLPGGVLRVEAVDASGVVLADADVELLEPGEAAVDLRVSPRATVRVQARRGVLPAPGELVELESDDAEAPEGDRLRRVTTGPDGRISVSLPQGTIRVTAVDALTGAVVEHTVTVGSTPVDVDLDLPVVTGAVSGRVTLIGGIAASSVAVSLADSGTVPTDAEGRFRFDTVLPGSRLVSAASGGASRSQLVTVVAGEESVLDLVLPGAAFYGRVQEPDGSAVATATLRACGPNNSPFVPLCVTAPVDGEGRFLLAGLPNWRNCPSGPTCNAATVTLTALLTDGSGLSAAVSQPFNASQTPVRQVDITLPETGSVAGSVRFHSGEPAADASVTVRSVTRAADATGDFRFPHVKPGAVSVFAASSPELIPGRSQPGVVAPAEELRLDVTLDATGVVAGTLLDEEGAPLERPMRVEALVASTLSGRWSRSVSTDAAGLVELAVPVGPWRLVFDGELDEAVCRNERPAAAEGELEEGERREATLRRGSHTLPPVLSGALGAYGEEATCDGIVAAAPRLTTLAAGGYDAVVRLEAEGRAYRTLREVSEGVEVRKQEFVPVSGAFARTLTLFTNRTAAPVILSVPSYLELPLPVGDACPGGSAWAVAETGTGDEAFDASDAWAVLRPVGGSTAFAVVFGLGLPRSGDSFWGGELPYPDDGCQPGTVGQIQTSQQLVLPAGATRALLTFTIARPAADAGLAAQARALADLSDPDALAFLTPEERAAIANLP